MTISITVSVNGNYKVPVTMQHGDGEATTEVISGRGFASPVVKHIPYKTGSVVTVWVGPEEPDHGEDQGPDHPEVEA